jgi:hypothetical protein
MPVRAWPSVPSGKDKEVRVGSVQASLDSVLATAAEVVSFFIGFVF